MKYLISIKNKNIFEPRMGPYTAELFEEFMRKTYNLDPVSFLSGLTFTYCNTVNRCRKCPFETKPFTRCGLIGNPGILTVPIEDRYNQICVKDFAEGLNYLRNHCIMQTFSDSDTYMSCRACALRNYNGFVLCSRS